MHILLNINDYFDGKHNHDESKNGCECISAGPIAFNNHHVMVASTVQSQLRGFPLDLIQDMHTQVQASGLHIS